MDETIQRLLKKVHEARISDLPTLADGNFQNAPGIYLLWCGQCGESRQCLYIGEAESLKKRIAQINTSPYGFPTAIAFRLLKDEALEHFRTPCSHITKLMGNGQPNDVAKLTRVLELPIAENEIASAKKEMINAIPCYWVTSYTTKMWNEDAVNALSNS